jgi:hypothetical protein
MLRSFRSAALLVSFAGAVALTGCGSGVAPQLQSATANVLVQASSSRSGMDPASKAGDLIYVSTAADQRAPLVEVYSWAKHEHVGDLTDAALPRFLCSDTAGDVFVPDHKTSQIFEYAHGGTSPIAILQDTGHSPRACGSDPVTGDLAVVDSDDIAIYQNASGTPARHTDSRFAEYNFCGYDDEGDLFVDGTTPAEHAWERFILAEIPKGQTIFTKITLQPQNAIPSEPGSVQWDGKYLAVGDAQRNEALQYKITGSTGAHQHTSYLDFGRGRVHQFWIAGSRHGTHHGATEIIGAQYVVGDRFEFGDVGFWAYPKSDQPKYLLDRPYHPLGVTVSIAPK